MSQAQLQDARDRAVNRAGVVLERQDAYSLAGTAAPDRQEARKKMGDAKYQGEMKSGKRGQLLG